MDNNEEITLKKFREEKKYGQMREIASFDSKEKCFKSSSGKKYLKAAEEITIPLSSLMPQTIFSGAGQSPSSGAGLSSDFEMRQASKN